MRIKLPKPQLKDTLQTSKGLDFRPLMRYANELRYHCSQQRFETLQRILSRSIRFEQLVAYDSKLRREGRSTKERDAILTNLYPCMNCGDPIYVKSDPSIAGGVKYYALCQDCKTPIRRLLKKIKVYFKSRFR